MKVMSTFDLRELTEKQTHGAGGELREYSPSMYSTLALSSAQQAHAHAHTHKLKTNYKTKNQK